MAKEAQISGLGDANEYRYVPMSMQTFTGELEREEVLTIPGIYRVAGSRRQCELFRQQFNQTGRVNFSSLSNTEVDYHTIADSFKQFIREVPGGILATWQQEQLADENSDVQFYHSVLLQTPQPQRDILVFLCFHLRKVASYADVNKMTNSNLARVFGPNLFEWKDAEWTDHTAGFAMTIAASSIFGKILDHFDQIFPNYQLTRSAKGERSSSGASTPLKSSLPKSSSFSQMHTPASERVAELQASNSSALTSGSILNATNAPSKSSIEQPSMRKDWESEGTVEFHSRLGTATTAQSAMHCDPVGLAHSGEEGDMSHFYHEMEREVSKTHDVDGDRHYATAETRNLLGQPSVSEESLHRGSNARSTSRPQETSEASVAKVLNPAERFLEHHQLHQFTKKSLGSLPASSIAPALSYDPSKKHNAMIVSSTGSSKESSALPSPFDTPVLPMPRTASKSKLALPSDTLNTGGKASVTNAGRELCPALSVDGLEFPAIVLPDVPAFSVSHSQFRELKEQFLTFHKLLKDLKAAIRALEQEGLSYENAEKRKQLQKIFRVRRTAYEEFKTYLEMRKNRGTASSSGSAPKTAAQPANWTGQAVVSTTVAVDMLNDLLVKLGRKIDMDLPDRHQLAQMSVEELEEMRSELKLVVSKLKIADKTPEEVLPGYETLSELEMASLRRLTRQELKRNWFEYCELKKLVQEKRDHTQRSKSSLS